MMVSDLLFRLCDTLSGAGNEEKIANLIKKEMQNFSKEIIIDKNKNVICHLNNTNAKKHILIEAHIDQISMVITAVDDNGFLSISSCGGVDCRVLPGSTVLICGKKIITGIVCTTPPHLIEKKDKNFEKTENLIIDSGISGEKLKNIVSVGDYVYFDAKPEKLLDNKITAPGLDNRAGVAVLIRCAQMLKAEKIDCSLTLLFSVQEETNSLGAKTAIFDLDPTEAIAVDVSFAKQPNNLEERCSDLLNGPMIGIAPSLSRSISNKITKLAEQNNIPYQLEIMSSLTGTTADSLTVSKGGIPCGLLSVPLRYMHSPVEVIDCNDIEFTAKLLCMYILTGGIDYE